MGIMDRLNNRSVCAKPAQWRHVTSASAHVRVQKTTDRVASHVPGYETAGQQAHGAAASDPVHVEHTTLKAMQEARKLVASAVEDLAAANGTMTQAHGLKGAMTTATAAAGYGEEKASWGDAGKALVHDGRIDAKKLVESAHEK